MWMYTYAKIEGDQMILCIDTHTHTTYPMMSTTIPVNSVPEPIHKTTTTINTTNDIIAFYDAQADRFSHTRTMVWPSTHTFLHSLSPHVRVLDVGCGNGRNMFERDDIVMVGLEPSKELCKIARERGALVINQSMECIPFYAKTFDVVMAIASYHHLSCVDQRKQAIHEFMRVMRPHGLLYIHVWAMEQPSYARRRFTSTDGNEWVSWKAPDGTTYMRYYHVYRKGELAKEITELSHGKLTCVHMEYEEGNWIGQFRFTENIYTSHVK